MLLAENAELKRQNGERREEIARLKCLSSGASIWKLANQSRHRSLGPDSCSGRSPPSSRIEFNCVPPEVLQCLREEWIQSA
jgi:hypothetical protein